MELGAANNDALIIPGTFVRRNIGSWDTMEVLHNRDDSGNVVDGNVLLMDTRNFIVNAGAARGRENRTPLK